MYIHSAHTSSCSIVIQLFALYFVNKKGPCYVGPYHHSIARPRVADGGTASSYGGTPPFLSSSALLSTLFSNTVSLYCFVNIKKCKIFPVFN
jgi:hypothetical protein